MFLLEAELKCRRYLYPSELLYRVMVCRNEEMSNSIANDEEIFEILITYGLSLVHVFNNKPSNFHYKVKTNSGIN